MDITPYREYTKQLFKLYDEIGLKSIDDFHGEDEERWDGKNFMYWFTDITRKLPRENEFVESDFKIYDDFVVLSGDIKFSAGMLHYLHPSITKAHDQFGATIIDRRYTMHIGYGYQSIYEFWDRIGDLLWHFFFTGIRQDSVYVGKVLNNIPAKYKTSDNYAKLTDLYSDFKDHFGMRHDIVHHFTLGTQLYWERTKAFRDYEANAAIIRKLEAYKDLITESLPACIDALEFALRLISEKGDLDSNELKEGLK